MDTEFIDVPVRAWKPGTARPDEVLERLVADLKERPGKWALYSKHNNMRTAYARSRALRKTRTPWVLRKYMDHLQFKTFNLEDHGPCVLVCWSEEGVVPQMQPRFRPANGPHSASSG